MPVGKAGIAVVRDDLAAAPVPAGGAPGGWAVAMADLVVELHGSFTDVDAMTAAIASCAVKMLPGVAAAGVVGVGKDGGLTCQAATNPQVLQMVQAEHRTGQGPCRHVLDRANPAKVVVDVPGNQRWPSYSSEARSIGIASVVAVRLEAGGGAGRVLLLIGSNPSVHRVVDGVDVFAAHAAVAVAQARTYADLVGALQNRDVIGQAKGILMERHQMTSGQAFALLAKTSQDTNIMLWQVADHIAGTGEIFGSAPLPRQRCS